MTMIDTDMISSPNFARLVYDGDGSEPGNPAGPPGSGEVERVFVDFWKSQGLSSEPIPFDGRSDYGDSERDAGVDRAARDDRDARPLDGRDLGQEGVVRAAVERSVGGAQGRERGPCGRRHPRHVRPSGAVDRHAPASSAPTPPM
jgi:hypothetical protein